MFSHTDLSLRLEGQKPDSCVNSSGLRHLGDWPAICTYGSAWLMAFLLRCKALVAVRIDRAQVAFVVCPALGFWLDVVHLGGR